jgi:hypothetical protein
MGMPFQAIVDGDPEAVRHVAGLVGCPVEPLMNATITRTGANFGLRGQQMQKATLRRAKVVVCPRCIADDLADDANPWMASGRVDWLLDPIRACRHHGLALMEVAHVDTPTMLHDFARCLAPSLSKIQGLSSEAEVVKPSPLEGYLIDRLDGKAGPDWLDALPWHAAAKACEMIGAVEVFGCKAPIKTMTDDQWREAGKAGYDIVSGGDGGIRAFLERTRANYKGAASDSAGPQAWFGRLHTWLTDVRDDAYDPLRGIIVDVVRNSAPVGPEDRLYGRQIVEQRKLHSIRTAALETGLHPKRLRRLLAAAGTIPSNHRDLTDDRVIFPAPNAEAILLKAKRAISELEAQTYLNAGRVHTRLLAQAGLIVPLATSGQEDLPRKAYDTQELDDFLTALSARAEIVPFYAEPIHRIPGAAKRANCSAIEIVRAILDGALKWVGQVAGEQGYMSILVNAAEVRNLVRGDHGDRLTLRAVEAQLKTSTAVVDALVRSGILPSERAISPLNRCPYTAVRAADLDAFCTTYGSLQELARERDLHFNECKKLLAANGVEPAFDKSIVPLTLYRRSDIPPGI